MYTFDDDIWVKNKEGNYVLWEEVWMNMDIQDSEVLQETVSKVAPCSEQEFFEAYNEVYKEHFGREYPLYSGWDSLVGQPEDELYEIDGQIPEEDGIIGKDGVWRPDWWYNYHHDLDPEWDVED